MDYDRQQLIDLVQRDAVRFGDFTLASGQKSSVYIDCRQVTLSARGAVLIGAGILDLLGPEPFDAVGGLTMGADPIIGAVLTVAGARGRPLRGFIVRKQAKEHGLGNLVEGPLHAGDRVLIVEDVATTGGSCQQALDAALARGCHVTRVVAVLDRLAGARERLAERGCAFSSLLTINDLSLIPPVAENHLASPPPGNIQ